MVRDAYGKPVTDEDILDMQYAIWMITWEQGGRKFRKKVGGKRYQLREATQKLGKIGATNIRIVETC